MSHKDDNNVLSGRLHRIIGQLCDLEDDLGIIYDELGVSERTCKFIDSNGPDYPPLCSSCGYELGIYDCAWYEDGTYGYERNYCPNCGAKVVSE